MSESTVIGTLRHGSSWAYWQPNGLLFGFIEFHPDFPPRMHYLDGRPPADFVPPPGMVETQWMTLPEPNIKDQDDE